MNTSDHKCTDSKQSIEKDGLAEHKKKSERKKWKAPELIDLNTENTYTKTVVNTNEGETPLKTPRGS